MSFIEKLAEIQHAIWAHWMKYLFSVSIRNPDGSFTIPADKVTRWERQMITPYSELSEAEQKSDLNQARKVKAVIDSVMLAPIVNALASLGAIKKGMEDGK